MNLGPAGPETTISSRRAQALTPTTDTGGDHAATSTSTVYVPATVSQHLDQALRAADVLAEHLGMSIAAHADGKNMTASQIEHVREAILIWHRLKTSMRGTK
jgi:hypothetical protein